MLVRPSKPYEGNESLIAKSGLKSKDVKAVIVNYMELKKNGSFKVGGCSNLKLKKKPATAARKGVIPFTKKSCVFKSEPASKTVKACCPGGAICVEEKKIDKKEKKIGVAALKVATWPGWLSVSGLHGSLMHRAVECGLLPKLADELC